MGLYLPMSSRALLLVACGFIGEQGPTVTTFSAVAGYQARPILSK